MFLAVYIATPPTIDSVPDGWELVATNATSNSRWYLYWKKASSEGASYTWGLTKSCRYYALNIAYSSGDFDVESIADITAISNTLYGTAGTTVRAASMSVPAANSPLVYFASVYNTTARTFTPPTAPTTDWVEDADEGHNTPDISVTNGSMIWTGSGATGAMDVICSITITTEKHAFAIALKPLSAPITADITEAVTASEAPTSTYIGLTERIEAVSGIDIQNVIALMVCAITEGVSVIDVTDGGLLLVASSTEAATGAELSNAIVVISAAVIEGISALELSDAVNIAIVSITEPATAADLSAVIFTGLSGSSEAAAATELYNSTIIVICSVSEPLTATDNQGVTGLLLSAIVETGMATDLTDATTEAIITAGIIEEGALTELSDALGIIVANISEASNVIESTDAGIMTGGSIITAAVIESINVQEAYDVIMTGLAARTEGINAIDNYSNINITPCLILETLSVIDTSDAIIPGLTSVFISEDASLDSQQDAVINVLELIVLFSVFTREIIANSYMENDITAHSFMEDDITIQSNML